MAGTPATAPPSLSAERLRRLALHHQGLNRRAPFGRSLSGLRRCIEHLGYVQIDTIAVVERAHHHTLALRVPGYQPAQLDRLQHDRKIFEYWYHAAAYLPIAHYRFALPHMAAVRHGQAAAPRADRRLMRRTLDEIRTRGPLRPRDLGQAGNQGGWWNWSPQKKALERLYFQGDVMISHRDGLEKVFDLRERLLPTDTDTRSPTLQEWAGYLLDNKLRHQGFTGFADVVYLRKGKALREALSQIIKRRLATGELCEVQAPWEERLYLPPDLLDSRLPRMRDQLRFLSPFDGLLIQRDRCRSLFQFDYALECYVPKARRRFGYFCLPLLQGTGLIGRADCKADRSEGNLRILSLKLEQTPGPDDAALVTGLEEIMRLNRCRRLTVEHTDCTATRRRLRSLARIHDWLDVRAPA